jgi:hypothetical protein
MLQDIMALIKGEHWLVESIFLGKASALWLCHETHTASNPHLLQPKHSATRL